MENEASNIIDKYLEALDLVHKAANNELSNRAKELVVIINKYFPKIIGVKMSYEDYLTFTTIDDESLEIEAKEFGDEPVTISEISLTDWATDDSLILDDEYIQNSQELKDALIELQYIEGKLAEYGEKLEGIEVELNK